MKVVLLEDIRGIGKKNALVNVSDGYAANFLFPKKLAIPGTPGEIAKHAARVKDEAANIARLEEEAKKMEKEPLMMPLKTGKNGEVFDSITKDDITKALGNRGCPEIRRVDLDHPIRTIGDHASLVHFAHGIVANITIRTTG